MGRKTLALTVLALSIIAVPPAHSEDTASIHGVVLSAGGDPVAGAIVTLPELRRESATDDGGRFAFNGLPEGDHLVNVQSDRFGGAVLRLAARPDPEGSVEITLDMLVHSGAISITAAGVARSLEEVATPVDVLSGEDLQIRKQSTLGETLAQQPGVNATTYGQGSSRPVIRGLGQDRIRILENGLDTGDVSSIGPDHAVAMDPLAAEQIEVVRGPAAVLWGANAIGGVVNVLDGRVPDRPSTTPLTGTVELEYGSNADKAAGAVKLDGGSGTWAWHADLYARDQDDYSSPAERPIEHEPGEIEIQTGTVENSWADARGATIGASYVTDRGFIGLAWGGYDTSYGIPGHDHHEHEVKADHDSEGGVHADLEQRRIDLHSQLDDPFGGFSAVRLSAGWRDYNHEEIEGETVGTRFDNRWTEGRLDFINDPVGGFTGTLGLQYVRREFAASGEEAFVQPTDTDKVGVYIFEESDADPLGLQLGLRFDDQHSRSADPELPDRSFATWTASIGAVWDLSSNWNLALSLNRPERAPTPEELYADGPHAATRAFEVGNPALLPEIGQGLDLSVRAEYGRFEATLTGFVTRYDQFIYLANTGETNDGLDVLQFTQSDADFRGFEVHGHFEVMHTGRVHHHLGFSYDQVRATFRETDEPLPRIPPHRTRLTFVAMSDRWDARLEGWWVAAQDRVAAYETPTPGYTTLNASVTYKIFGSTTVHEFLLRGRNLLNAAAYNHTSFIKVQAPLPGRDVSLVYRLHF